MIATVDCISVVDFEELCKWKCQKILDTITSGSLPISDKQCQQPTKDWYDKLCGTCH